MDRIFDFAAGAGIVQGLFVAGLLFAGQRGRVPGNRILAFLLVSLAASTAHPFFGPYIAPARSPSFSIDPIQSFLSPLIWFFVSARAAGRRFLPRDFLHFLPSALVCAFLLASLRFFPPAGDFAIGASIVYWALALAQGLAYFVLSSRAIAAYSLRLEQSYSKLDAFRLEGLHAFMSAILLLMAGRLATLAVFAHNLSGFRTDRLMELLQAFIVYFLGVFMVLRREPEALPRPETPGEPPAASGKYGKSLMGADRVAAEFARVGARVGADKLYLDPELSLPALAAALGLGRNDLSRIINEGGGSSFYDFINRFRVQEFQALARDPSKASWKILALAFEAGFNSKPAFNSAFKRLAGTTPSAWLASGQGG